jgi:hypothetical protein
MMETFRSSRVRAHIGILSGIAVSLATLTCIVAFGPPAGAAAARTSGFGPHHDSSVATSQSVLAHDVTPLSQANIVVTDLTTNVSTVYEYSNVTPMYGTGFCNVNTQSALCFQYGDGPNGPDGGFLNLTAQANPWSAGSSYAPAGGAFGGFSAGGLNCGGAVLPVSTAVELDQYDFSSGQLNSAAVQVDCITATFEISGTIAYNIVPTDPENGYYLFGQAGEIAGFGNDNYLSYLNGAQYVNLNAPIVGMAPTPDGGGYWMVATDGGVFSSGDAGFYGSTGNIHLNEPVVGMTATPDGKGYWFVASDGGIFAYGDAAFYGSTGGQHLNQPIVGMAATPDGRGYWLVASDGGIFAYGDAQFFGSTGAIHLNEPVVGMVPTPSGDGYWFVASDGGVFAYGDAQFYGSTGAIHLNSPIVGMTGAPDGAGYWFTASDGGVFNYGSAGFFGSLGGTGINDVAGMSLGM